MLRLFCFKGHYQYTPLIYLLPLVFGLMLCGWRRSITLNPTYSIISYVNTIFYLHLFYLRPLFKEHR